MRADARRSPPRRLVRCESSLVAGATRFAQAMQAHQPIQRHPRNVQIHRRLVQAVPMAQQRGLDDLERVEVDRVAETELAGKR